ncbi:MAG: SOS response-associated peptidase family protein [bacterium]
MAGLEGIDASSMEVIDALGGTRYVYDAGDRIARPLVHHADFLPVARLEGGERVVDKVRLGMPVGPRLLTNARGDNLVSPAWRGLFGKPEHHALAAISYVVERDAKTKAAFRIQRRDGKLMVVAALMARRHYAFTSTGNEYDDLGHVQVTAPANDFVAQVHDRFVVELDSRVRQDAWMDPAATGKEALQNLLVPAANDAYEMVPIAEDVWKRRGDPEAVKPQGGAKVWGEASAKKPQQAKLG